MYVCMYAYEHIHTHIMFVGCMSCLCSLLMNVVSICWEQINTPLL